MFDNVKKIFSDDLGNLSSMRLIAFLIIVVVLFNWTFYNIKNGVYTPLSFGDISAMIGALWMKSKQKTYEDVLPG